MRPSEMEDTMRAFESYHRLRVMPDLWTVLRMDGRGFTKFTESQGFNRPFDPLFHEQMVKVAEFVLRDLGGIYAYTESDEISVLLPRDTDLFGREVEKLVSVSGGTASGMYASVSGRPVSFDSRVVTLPTVDRVVDYFRWRQADAARCCLNGYVYWTMRKADNWSSGKATSAMKGMHRDAKHEYLHNHGIHFGDLPDWQKKGVGLCWESYTKVGHNPITGQDVTAIRRRIKLEEHLPRNDEYQTYLEALIERDMLDRKG